MSFYRPYTVENPAMVSVTLYESHLKPWTNTIWSISTTLELVTLLMGEGEFQKQKKSNPQKNPHLPCSLRTSADIFHLGSSWCKCRALALPILSYSQLQNNPSLFRLHHSNWWQECPRLSVHLILEHLSFPTFIYSWYSLPIHLFPLQTTLQLQKLFYITLVFHYISSIH